MRAGCRAAGARGTCAAVLVCALAAAIAAGCGSSLGLVRSSDTVDRSLEVAPGTPVRVEAFNGAIEVTTAAGNSLSARVERTGEGRSRSDAEADRDRIAVTFDLVDGTAVLRAVYQPNPDSIPGGRSAAVTLRVPEGTPLDLETSNGPVRVTGAAAPVAVRTSNGPVTLAGVTSAVSVETSNGPISVQADDATADLRTSNGALTFAGSLRAGNHAFETSNGPIELRLPTGSSFTVDAETSNGSTSTDFPLAGVATKDALRGTVGPAGEASATSIAARTSNGSIDLRGT